MRARFDAGGMKNTNRTSDPVIDMILGKDEPCTSWGYAIGATFVSCLVLAAVVAVGLIDRDFAFAVIAVIVVAVAWWTSPASAVAAAGVGFLFADGFVFDAAGTLAWHGEGDVLRLTTLVCLAIVTSLFGHLHRHRRRSGGRAQKWLSSSPSA